ncbi:MAG: extracellular solute-binding protein [Ferrimicrobium sp.]
MAYCGIRISRLSFVACICGAAAIALGACGSVGSARAGRSSGVADVAYAGSLELLNEKTIGPAFARSSGFSYLGRGGGSLGLSNEIRGGEIASNVFESIGAAPILSLEPRLTRWYVRIAASPIVVAYNQAGPYARQLSEIARGAKPLADLFSILSSPGFHLGRTNPNTDPQGQAFYEMVELAQRRLRLPTTTVASVLGSVDNPAQVFSETALEARLTSGQLDAASAFLSQAIQLHLPYILLPSVINFGNPKLAATYARAMLQLPNGKVVHGAPLVVDATVLGRVDSAAAQAFIAYQFSHQGQSELQKGGYQLLPPLIVGSNVPGEVRNAIDKLHS